MKRIICIAIAALMFINSLPTFAQADSGKGSYTINTADLSGEGDLPNQGTPSGEEDLSDKGNLSGEENLPGEGDLSGEENLSDEGDLSGEEDIPGEDPVEGELPDDEELPDEADLPDNDYANEETILAIEPLQALDGELDDYIQIDNAASLAQIGQDEEYPLNGSYILTDNIVLEDKWEPVGSAAHPFVGIFNGDGHTISGLMIDQPDNPAGFFSVVGQGAKIQNVTVEVISVIGGTNVGALAGKSIGTSFRGCFAVGGGSGTVTGDSQVGGLVGDAMNKTTFTGCGAAVDVLSENGWVGGLVGQIVGTSATSRALIDFCYATGKVEQTASESSSKGAGGLAGYTKNVSIKNSYAAGEVISRYLQAGGLVGSAESTDVEKSMASGNVMAYANNGGGLIGYTNPQSSIGNCVAANKYAAVFIVNKISNRITPVSKGTLNNNISYVNMACFNTGDSTDTGTSKTIDELRTDSTYTALEWDFNDVWVWDAGGQCPKLRTADYQPADTLNLNAQAPRITTQPYGTIYAYIGEKLEVSVTAAGTDLQYQWKKDGIDLIDSGENTGDEDQEIISGAKTPTLIIENVQYSPNSAYVVLIKNSYGDTVSHVSTVNVIPEASVPKVTNPEGQIKVEGERAVISITAEKSRPAENLTFQWEKSTDNGESWNPISKALSDTYTTPTLTKADSGSQYRCVVTNTYYTTSKVVTTKAATLTVLKAIKSVGAGETNIVMKVGETKQLSAWCLPEDAEQEKGIRWDVGYGSAVIDVDRDTGEVYARNAGKASITATVKANYDLFAVCFITVEEESEAETAPILIETEDAQINNGKIVDDLTDPFGNHKTIVLRASEAVTWKSKDPTVAAIDKNGTVTYKTSGTTAITAANTQGRSASITLTIRDLTPKLPMNTISVYTGSEDGSAITILSSDHFIYDDIRIESVSPVQKNGTFAINTAKAPLCYLSAAGVPRGKYVLELRALQAGEEIGSDFKITVNVYDSVPVAKVKLPTLNTFYKEAEGTITITGRDLPVIEEVKLLASEKASEGDVTKNFGISKEEGEYVLYSMEEFGSLIKNKPAVKGILQIWYQGYSEPYSVKVTIPVKKTAPKIKFSKAVQPLDPENGLSVDFEVIGGEVVNVAPFSTDSFYKQYEKFDFYENVVTLSLDYDTLYNDEGDIRKAVPGKTYSAKMNLWLKDAREPLPLTAKIKVLKPGTKPSFNLSKASITLNRRYEGQKHTIDILCNQANADYKIDYIDCNEKLDIGNFGESMTVMLNPNCPTRTFKCRVAVSYEDTTTILIFYVKVIDRDIGIDLTGRKGNIDLCARENTSIEFKPVLRDYLGDITKVWLEGYGEEEYDDLFTVSLTDGGNVRICAKTGLDYDEEFIVGRTYKFKLGFTLEAIEADNYGNCFYENAVTGVISVRPNRSKVKHDLPKSVTMYESRTSYEEIIDLNPTNPIGAKIDHDSINVYCSGANSTTEAFYCYLDDLGKLHIMLKDNSKVKLGKNTLTFPVIYEGQGLEKTGTDYDYKPVTLKIVLNVVR